MTNPFVTQPQEDVVVEPILPDPVVGDSLTLVGLSSGALVRDVTPPEPLPDPVPVVKNTVVLYPASGGVGVSTLAALAGECVLDGGVYLLWEGAPVWVVSATHRVGLDAAAETMRQVARGELPVSVRGLVLVHDREKLPKDAVRYSRQIAGLFPETITIPYMASWRDGPPGDLEDSPARVRAGIQKITEKGDIE